MKMKTIRSKSSIVWKYFDEPNEDRKVLCKLCETKLSFVGGTSVMYNHLKVKHPSSAAVAETDESDGERPQLQKQPSIMQAFVGSSFSSDKASRLTELIVLPLVTN